MTVKTQLKRRVMRYLFSLKRRDARRTAAERKRQSSGAPHVVEYFHEAGDPYSHLMVQLLPEFCERYDLELKSYIVPPPEDWAAPERSRLNSYGRKDAELLAKRIGLSFSDTGQAPRPEGIQVANSKLAEFVGGAKFLESACRIGEALWANQLHSKASQLDARVTNLLKQGAARRDTLGHYLGGTLHYAGEWYWGPDRLHYLETRLNALGAYKGDNPKDLIFSPPGILGSPPIQKAGPQRALHWYLSFRSPYTGIIGERVKALADAYGAELKLRFVLPMAMRSLPVPQKKGLYIMSDVVREAQHVGVRFGDSVDPLGEPVERGYAILSRAIELGKGYAFAQSFLQGVWADGIDAGSDKGLKKITERAELNWSEMKTLIGGDHWQAEAEANCQEMLDLGIWGVPSFRVDDLAIWGQDRLWVIEDALAG
jgi:2-hydroxychromene-2-carboxylate isomerase